MNSQAVPKDIDCEIGELLRQLRLPEVKAWLEDQKQCASEISPRRSTAESVARMRQTLSRVESFMDAASTSNFESAPSPVKRVTELLFDINTREHLFALMLAHARQLDRSAESDANQSNMHHVAELSTR